MVGMTSRASESTGAPGASPSWPDLLTPAEVAAVLRIDRNSVYRLVHAQALRGVRVGRLVRIYADSVREHLS